jgi:PAS domain S-box-containing protein
MDGLDKPLNTLNNRHLELALESSGIGTWALHRETNQLLWSSGAKTLFGFTGSDIINPDILLDHIHEKDRENFAGLLSMAFTASEPFVLELRTREDNAGKYRWLLCKGGPHRDSGMTSIVGTFIDITQEVKNRNILREETKRSENYETIVKQVPLAIALLSGPGLIIALANGKMLEVWGKSPSVSGMSLKDAFREADGQGFTDLVQRVYDTGKSHEENGSMLRLARNGQVKDVYFDFVYTALREPDGTVTGVMVTANEVTEKYQAIIDLEAEESKFRTLIDEIPVGISVFTGEEMLVELLNPPMARYWGKDMSVVGKPLREALPELDGQPFHQILSDVYQQGITFSAVDAPVDLEVDGKLSRYYFSFTYKPLFNASGKVRAIIDMSIDVTAQVLAQKALQESESKLRTVIASAPVAIGLFVGRDLLVELPNRTFIDIVGKGPDIEGRPLREVMPELEDQPFLQILDDVYTTGNPYKSFGTQVDIVRDGVMTHNYYDITYSPIYDPDGKVYAILDMAADVTERVDMDGQIKQSQLQLLSLFEQSPVGIAMIHKDNLVFTMANPFFGALVGRKPEDVTGKPLMEALPEMKGQGLDKLLLEVIGTGVPFLAREQAVDISYGDGLKTIYVNLACQPQRDLTGEIIGVLVVITDLTDQVLSRIKIEKAEVFLRGAIELAELGTYSFDMKTGMVDCSDRIKHWFGLDKEENITIEKVYESISAADLPAVAAAVEHAIRPGTDGLYEMEYMMDEQKTGSARILHAQGRVLYDDQRNPVSMIGTARDITGERKVNLALELQVQERTQELAAMNEELAAVNEEYIATNEELSDSNNLLLQSNLNLQQFAYVASHDLQEPLRKIQSFSNLLTTRYGEQLGDGIDYLRRMQSAARRMTALIEDLLAFSRITTIKERTETVSLSRVIQDVLTDLELTITESSAQIQVGNLPDVQGDRTQLNQLFLNLISNALKFRKPDQNPALAISSEIVSGHGLPASLSGVRPAESFYKIDVSDNGIGFDQQYAERIFQLFQRLHGRSEYAGTGIGLAICERVASNHGGGITATSQAGHGATFSVFLPAD